MRKNAFLALAAAGVIIGGVRTASAQVYSLFTTHDDFAGNPSTGWSGWNTSTSNGEQISFNGPDLDGSTINGIGNYNGNGGGTSPLGGTSPGGSLTIQNYQGGYDTVTTANEAPNSAFASALYGTHGSGILTIDFTSPLGGTTISSLPSTGEVGPYFLIGFLLYSNNPAYASGWVNAGLPPGGGIMPYSPTNPDPGNFGDAAGAYVINHGTYWTGYIPYSGILPPSDYTNLQFGIIVNSGDSNPSVPNGTQPYTGTMTIDDIGIVHPQEGLTTWALTGGGSWATASNWTSISAVPNSQGSMPEFGQLSSPSTITMDVVPGSSNWTVGNLVFDSPGAGYTFSSRSKSTYSAMGGLIFDNGAIPGQIQDNGGTHTFNIPIRLNSTAQIAVANAGDGLIFNNTLSGSGGLVVSGSGSVTLNGSNTYAGSTNINGGNLIVTAAGGLPTGNSVTLGNATLPSSLKFSRGLGTFTLSNLLTTNPATFSMDIANDIVQVNYAAAGNSSPLLNLEGGLADSAITSSDLPAGYAIGSVDNATSLVLERALIGDTNLDGTVNLTDLLTLLNSYGQTGEVWSQGDFNYDGTINLTDLLGLLNNFGMTASSSAFGSTQVVPEPATASLITLMAAGLLARRRVCI